MRRARSERERGSAARERQRKGQQRRQHSLTGVFVVHVDCLTPAALAGVARNAWRSSVVGVPKHGFLQARFGGNVRKRAVRQCGK